MLLGCAILGVINLTCTGGSIVEGPAICNIAYDKKHNETQSNKHESRDFDTLLRIRERVAFCAYAHKAYQRRLDDYTKNE